MFSLWEEEWLCRHYLWSCWSPELCGFVPGILALASVTRVSVRDAADLQSWETEAGMSVPVLPRDLSRAGVMCALPGSCSFSGVQFPGSTSRSALSDGQWEQLRDHLKADLCPWQN